MLHNKFLGINQKQIWDVEICKTKLIHFPWNVNTLLEDGKIKQWFWPSITKVVRWTQVLTKWLININGIKIRRNSYSLYEMKLQQKSWIQSIIWAKSSESLISKPKAFLDARFDHIILPFKCLLLEGWRPWFCFKLTVPHSL